ncbi:hypothetical protein BDV37DRAFT_265626 [Aspergillus pseudonomiae]|uniref:Ankyrin repeat-containing domain protein n=1 Tax=Aspergillus pseudonomiae TaxID=1506151 RepID=A0A5N7CTX2_9EURO|nr:uncharacterized protein BDV37DRAFT_265626 [Aspergillus pseudonomiae]KAE8397429.1 hypothetical protein BDV37DRAFT_265626 [Aspergillus pseudonomiae]
MSMRGKSTDAHGNTVLHLAAAKVKPNSVRWILSRTQVLLQQRNGQGETPLDVLLTNLEESRTTHRLNALTEDVSDQFTGFSDTAVICLISTNGGIRVTGVKWHRLKYGCTCGQCISGFLSPCLTFLPRNVQNNLKTDKSMRKGFMNLCNHLKYHHEIGFDIILT